MHSKKNRRGSRTSQGTAFPISTIDFPNRLSMTDLVRNGRRTLHQGNRCRRCSERMLGWRDSHDAPAPTVSNSLRSSTRRLTCSPKRLQPAAKEKIHQIYLADTRQPAGEAFDPFLKTYEAKYPKAADCLRKDRESLLAFYDFPAEYWKHLLTTNPIESTFATVRL